MARRKSRLWLHPPKRKIFTPKKFNDAKRPKIQNKRFGTPSQRTPKRCKLGTPKPRSGTPKPRSATPKSSSGTPKSSSGTPKSCSKSHVFDNDWEDCDEVQHFHKGTQVDHSSCSNYLHSLFDNALSAMDEERRSDFIIFLRLVHNAKLPLDNISFLLFWRLSDSILWTIVAPCGIGLLQKDFGKSGIGFSTQIFCIFVVVQKGLVACKKMYQSV
jgi:hypothetical protein